MRHEAVYRTYQELEKKAEKAYFAHKRLAATANRLQNGDYSQNPRLDPTGLDHSGVKKDSGSSIERVAAIVRVIKESALPQLKDEIKTSQIFKQKHGHEFPLRIQMREEREKRGITKADVVRVDEAVGPQIYAFESGGRPPSERVINQYATVLNLSSIRRRELQERRKTEMREREMEVVRQRKKPENVFTFGQRLRVLRESMGFSYQELGRRTGLSPQVFFQIEHGLEDRATYEATLMRLWRSHALPIPEEMMPEWFSNPQNMSEYLRSLRFRAGVTRAEFSTKTGRHVSSIKSTEDGSSVPSAKTIKLYEQVLGITIEFNKPQELS